MPLPLLGGGRGSKQRAGHGPAARWAEGKAPRRPSGSVNSGVLCEQVASHKDHVHVTSQRLLHPATEQALPRHAKLD